MCGNSARHDDRAWVSAGFWRRASAIAIVTMPALVATVASAGEAPPPEAAGMSTDTGNDTPAPALAGRFPILPGQLSNKFGIDDAHPEASVPGNRERDRNPLEFGYFLQDLLERADQAQKKKDDEAVVRYYRAVAAAVPDNAKGWSKLCEAYDRIHDRRRAIASCRYAIDRPAVELQDYVRYVHLVIGKTTELDPKERTELDAVLIHLDQQEGMALAANHLRCEVGIKAKDVAMMETCTQVLAKLAPDDPKTVVFRWSLAVMKGQGAEAERLLVSARAAGVAHESIERMESVMPPTSKSRWRTAGVGATVLGVFASAAAALFAAVRRRRVIAGRAVT